MKYRLQNMFNPLVGEAGSIPSSLNFILLGFDTFFSLALGLKYFTIREEF